MTTPVDKQSYEAFFIAGNFVLVMEEGETIVLEECAVTAIDKDGNDVSSTFLDQTTIAVASITKLKIRIRAGTQTASPYKVTFRIVTSLGNKYEVDAPCRVKEK